MILFTDKNIGFVHIPKCGGTSVTDQIKKLNEGWIEIEGIHTSPKKILDLGHDVKGWIFQVRNPYTRFVSAYNHMIKENNSISLNDILNYMIDEPDANLWPIEKKGHRILFRKQLYWYVSNMPFFKLEDKSIWRYLNLKETISNTSKIKNKIKLDDKQKEVIYNFYKEDFLTFGYSK